MCIIIFAVLSKLINPLLTIGFIVYMSTPIISSLSLSLSLFLFLFLTGLPDWYNAQNRAVVHPLSPLPAPTQPPRGGATSRHHRTEGECSVWTHRCPSGQSTAKERRHHPGCQDIQTRYKWLVQLVLYIVHTQLWHKVKQNNYCTIIMSYMYMYIYYM